MTGHCSSVESALGAIHVTTKAFVFVFVDGSMGFTSGMSLGVSASFVPRGPLGSELSHSMSWKVNTNACALDSATCGQSTIWTSFNLYSQYAGMSAGLGPSSMGGRPRSDDSA